MKNRIFMQFYSLEVSTKYSLIIEGRAVRFQQKTWATPIVIKGQRNEANW
jgi:hypothetical protein